MTPVFVNVFNRLTTTRRLCEQIARLDEAFPVIVDNASTWEPLLEWYESCQYELIRLDKNLGHHAPWLSGSISRWPTDYYVVTDCDLDISGVPADAIQRLIVPLRNAPRIVKSGLSLEINDLPPWQSDVVKWESQFWMRRHRVAGFFDAWVDTTFAVYSRHTPHRAAMRVTPAVRSDRPYTARHLPWYLDGTCLDAENANYFATSSQSNTWRPNGAAMAAEYVKA